MRCCDKYLRCRPFSVWNERINVTKKLLFVSPRFLFPTDSGGKIRTYQILRGMKGGAFHITLVSPASKESIDKYLKNINGIADDFIAWPEPLRPPFFNITRMRYLFSSKPIPVMTDHSTKGSATIAAELEKRPDIVIFDFAHSIVLAPPSISIPSVLFTHNVEAEIFKRHVEVERNLLKKLLWKNQWHKMEQCEYTALAKFDSVIAVSEKDAKHFKDRYHCENVSVIATGVDLEYFDYFPPKISNKVVFTGSMDWLANIDGIEYFIEEIWPAITAECPNAFLHVVGRNPPATLVNKAKSRGLACEFSGFVDDIRPYVRESSVYVVPLRVGGGTRIKVFESMAMGCPVVSTSVGVEGLPLAPDQHYLRADTADEFAKAVVRLLKNEDLRNTLSRRTRQYVENNFSFTKVAQHFEEICLKTIEGRKNKKLSN